MFRLRNKAYYKLFVSNKQCKVIKQVLKLKSKDNRYMKIKRRHE